MILRYFDLDENTMKSELFKNNFYGHKSKNAPLNKQCDTACPEGRNLYTVKVLRRLQTNSAQYAAISNGAFDLPNASAATCFVSFLLGQTMTFP